MSQIVRFYKTMMDIGQAYGCHQRKERSFFLFGKQFPVCARCTGVLFGEGLALILFRVLELPTEILLSFCAIMFLDWLIQYLNILESNNGRRFFTGCLCGYAFSTFFLRLLIFIKHFAAMAAHIVS